MRYVSNVRVLCKEEPVLATALPVLDGQEKKNWAKSIRNGRFYNTYIMCEILTILPLRSMIYLKI